MTFSFLTTIFVCQFCFDNYTFKSADALRTHIQTVHGQEMRQKLNAIQLSSQLLKP